MPLKKIRCKFCDKKEEIKDAKGLLQCATCKFYCHASCLDLPESIVPRVKTYDWQCNDCKYCFHCETIHNEDQILFCDDCDRGYHMYCVTPKLKKKPKGDWFCPICVERKKHKHNEEEKEEKMEVDDEEKPPLEEAPPKQQEPAPPSAQPMDEGDDDTEDDIPLKKFAASAETPSNREQERVSKTQTNKSYSSPAKACPFPGCDGSGNVKAGSSHYTLKNCPLVRDERIRERELLKSESPRKTPENKENPSTHSTTTKQSSSKNVLREDHTNNTPSSSTSTAVTLKSNQTPIEHIVSSSDLDMFQKAKEKAATLAALEKEILPGQDERKIAIFGEAMIEAWYKSHYPLEFSKSRYIYICEFCLSYFKQETIYKRHMEKCIEKHPPGDEIYRQDKLSVFEVDGKSATTYCQNLCLFAKMFLDHKTLWNDVAPFLFYVMTVADDRGCQIIGYFSKEKKSFLQYNVSCILVLPQHMRKGYGKLLIEFSYLLSQVEGKVGSPERPLSDLGLMSYRKYWQDRLINYLMDYDNDNISIKEISEKMSLHPNDIISTLQFLGMLKYWKGRHMVLLRKEIIAEYSEKAQNRPDNYKTIDPNCLQWTPKEFK